MVGFLLNLKIEIATEINVVCKVKAQPLMPFAEPCGAKKEHGLAVLYWLRKAGKACFVSCRPPRGQYAARRFLVAVNMFSKI